MERVPLKSALAGLAVFGLLLAGPSSPAANPTAASPAPVMPRPPGPPPETTSDEKPLDETPQAGGRNLAKVRPGSVLRSDKLLPGRTDLRSEAERQRDAELTTHYSRLAELDVIAALAADSDDVMLQEEVEQVRRKEMQRHQKVMMALKRAATRTAALAGARK